MPGHSKDLVCSWLCFFLSSKSLAEIVCQSPVLSRTDRATAGMDCHTVTSVVGCNFNLSSGHTSSPESFITVKGYFPCCLQSTWSRARPLSGCGNLNWWMTLMAVGMGWVDIHIYYHCTNLVHSPCLLCPYSLLTCSQMGGKGRGSTTIGAENLRAEDLPLVAMAVKISLIAYLLWIEEERPGQSSPAAERQGIFLEFSCYA